MCFACAGYQADDVEMVTVSSSSVDPDAVLFYPAGLDISIGTSSAAGSTSGSDTHIADSSTSTAHAANVQQPLSDADLCDNNLSQDFVTELPEFAAENAAVGE